MVMAITPLPHPTPAGVVRQACAVLDPLATTLWSARSDEEVTAGLEQLQRLKATTAAVEAQLLAEVDVRGTAKRRGWASTTDWFTHVAGTTRRAGRRAVVHARLLTTQRRATLTGLLDGTVSPDQAEVILDAVDRLPLADHVRRRGEQVLWRRPAG